MGRKARDKKNRPVPALPDGPSATVRNDAAPAQADAPGNAAFPSPRRREASARQRSVARASSLPRLLPWLALLLLATVVAWAGALDTPFLLDDPVNITKNPQIERMPSLVALLRDPRAFVTATLHWNWAAGGFAVAGYHVLNIAAHAATGILVFLLSRATLALLRERRAGGTAGARGHDDAVAAVVALVFLLHPMQTESVTYVIQRAEVFVSAGLLASLLALTRMRDGVDARAMGMLAAGCVLGIWSKPSFAVVPVLLAAFDALLLGEGRLREMARRWPAYALATLASVVTFALTRAAGSFGNSTAGFDIEGITPAGYLSAQFGVIVHYLRVALWPNDLCFDCGYRGPWPVLASPLGNSVAIPAAMLALLAAAAFALRRRQPLFAFAVFGSAAVLAPTSTFVPLADFYVEHRMYLPLAFVAMALVPAADDAIRAMAARAGASSRQAAAAGAALAAVVVVALAASTMARNELLSDPIALMEDSLAKAPQNERVQYNLANAYKRVGRVDDAIRHYEAAIRLLPNVVRSYENLGSLYLEQGRTEDALRVFEAGAAAKPDAAMAHRNVAVACLKLGKPEDALAAARRSLALEPASTNGQRLAGDALMALGRRDEAVAAWRAGLKANPNEASLRERLRKAGAN